MRDDFSQRTKDLLANRVGWKCSNPNCRKATRGAGIGKENIINIGVASHITIAKLKKWKEISEQMAVLDLEEATAEEQHEDKELIKFFVQCFDRPAFQDRIYQEGRMEDFDKAIEDTIIALNTGVLRTRDGSILKKADGKSSVVNIEWREKLNTICDMLVALRKRLKIAKDTGAYSLYGEDDVMYCFYDRDLAIWFDSTREEILKILSSICEEIGIHGLGFPRKRYEW